MPRRLDRFLAFSFLALFSLSAAPGAASAEPRYEKKFQPFLTRRETTWSVAAGFRHDKFDWNIAGDLTGTAVPNILAEEEYKDILTLEVKGGVRHLEPADIAFINGAVHLEAEVTGGFTLDGESQISEYAGNNRTLETNRQVINNFGGDVIGGGVAIGYRIDLTGTPGRTARRIMNSKAPSTELGKMRKQRAMTRAMETAGPYFSVTPLVGYAIDQQTYHGEDAIQIIANANSPPQGPFNTDTSFVSNWYGPFMGLEGEIKTRKHMLRLRGEYHDMAWYGKSIEPSRNDLEQDPSWDMDADGKGIELGTEYAYALADDYALTLDGHYRSRDTDPGVFTFYPRNANEIKTRLNEANDESIAARIGLRFNWN